MTRGAGSPPTGTSADEIGALARGCAEATLAHIEASVDELGQAGALLGDAMAALRGNFAAALAANADAADPDACRHHLEAAMVALQCEDALVQMLESMRRRSLRTADALRRVLAPGFGAAGADPTAAPRDDRTAREETAARLRRAVVALDADGARTGPVRQTRAVVGTVELF